MLKELVKGVQLYEAPHWWESLSIRNALIMGERMERLSRNTYKGPMDNVVGEDWMWEVGVGSMGERVVGEKMETTITEQQFLKKQFNIKKRNALSKIKEGSLLYIHPFMASNWNCFHLLTPQTWFSPVINNLFSFFVSYSPLLFCCF